ncbi:hypothetical protein O1L60_17570 [Streptomyces diastatochromogenes]|nr:hypothetical protein [Streptomyces diastatochromogenes]
MSATGRSPHVDVDVRSVAGFDKVPTGQACSCATKLPTVHRI